MLPDQSSEFAGAGVIHSELKPVAVSLEASHAVIRHGLASSVGNRGPEKKR